LACPAIITALVFPNIMPGANAAYSARHYVEHLKGTEYVQAIIPDSRQGRLRCRFFMPVAGF